MSSVSPFREDLSAPTGWTHDDRAETDELLGELPFTAGADWEASDALERVESWAETPPATHPLMRVFPLPGAVLDALSGGLAPLAVGLAASAGYTDINQLTNIVFYFRHPELIGRKIEPGQHALAEEWVSIRDRIVKPAMQSVPRDAGRVATGHAITLGAARRLGRAPRVAVVEPPRLARALGR